MKPLGCSSEAVTFGAFGHGRFVTAFPDGHSSWQSPPGVVVGMSLAGHLPVAYTECGRSRFLATVDLSSLSLQRTMSVTSDST